MTIQTTKENLYPQRENEIGNKIYRYWFVAQLIEWLHGETIVIGIDETNASTY